MEYESAVHYGGAESANGDIRGARKEKLTCLQAAETQAKYTREQEELKINEDLLRFYIGFSLTGLCFQGRSGAAQSSFLRVDFSQQGGFVPLRLLSPTPGCCF